MHGRSGAGRMGARAGERAVGRVLMHGRTTDTRMPQAEERGVQEGWRIRTVNGTAMTKDEVAIHGHIGQIKERGEPISIGFEAWAALRDDELPSCSDRNLSGRATPLMCQDVEEYPHVLGSFSCNAELSHVESILKVQRLHRQSTF